MQAKTVACIESELREVDNIIKRYYKLKSGNATQFAHLNPLPIDRYLRPACVLLTAGCLGALDKRAVGLATIVQLVFLAAEVHAQVPDLDLSKKEAEQGAPRDGTQLPVLVGDYLWGKFFATVCDLDRVDMLGHVAQHVCQISEGSVLRKLAGEKFGLELQQLIEVTKREYALLVEGCCSLVTKLVGSAATNVEKLTTICFNLGMASGLLNYGMRLDLAATYAKQAREEAETLQSQWGKGFVQLATQLHSLAVQNTPLIVER